MYIMESVNTSSVILSHENSTKVKLLANQTFTGKSISVKQYIQVIINCVSDKPCIDNGILVQFSTDETSWVTKYSTQLTEEDGFYNTNETYLVTCSFMRVVFTNGPIDQNTMSMQVYLKVFRDPELLGNAKSIIRQNQITNMTRLSSEFKRDVAMGKIEGNRNFIVNGTRTLGVTDEFTTISSIAAKHYTFPTVARKVYCVSDSLDDVYGGQGVNVVILFGLDANFNEIKETIIMTGTTNTALTAQEFIRINNFACAYVGSYSSANMGHISLYSDVDHIELSCICPKQGRSINAIYTVPKGYSCVIPRASFVCGNSHTADFNGYFRENNVPIGPPYKSPMIINTISDFSGITEMKPEEFIKFNECTDIWVEAAKSSGIGTAKVSIIYDVDLIKNC